MKSFLKPPTAAHWEEEMKTRKGKSSEGK